MGKRGLIFALMMVSAAGCKKSAPLGESSLSPQPALQGPSTPSGATPEATPSSQLPVSRPATVPQATEAPPQFGWKQYAQENVTVMPSQGQFFVVPRNAPRLRVVIGASLPFFAGVMSKDSLKSKGVVMASNFNSLPCAFVKTASGERECSLDTQASEVFVLRDLRESATQPAGKMPAENKIGIAMSAWACVAHCKAMAESGR